MLRRALPIVLLVMIAACSKSSPTAPSGGGGEQTRVIALSGALGFGIVEIGGEEFRTFTLSNLGNAPLTVTGTSSPDASNFALTWTSGTVPAGGSQQITVRFRPTVAKLYSGNITIAANHTSGSNTIPFSGQGVNTGPLWTRSGTGNTVFDMPASINRVRVTGTTSSSCQNFIVRRNGPSFINVIIGTCSVADAREYAGTHLVTGGGVIEIVSSEGVNWTFTEER